MCVQKCPRGRGVGDVGCTHDLRGGSREVTCATRAQLSHVLHRRVRVSLACYRVLGSRWLGDRRSQGSHVSGVGHRAPGGGGSHAVTRVTSQPEIRCFARVFRVLLSCFGVTVAVGGSGPGSRVSGVHPRPPGWVKCSHARTPTPDITCVARVLSCSWHVLGVFLGSWWLGER